jgi:hypothetical protein
MQEFLHLIWRYQLRQLAVLLVQRPVLQLALLAAVERHAAAAAAFEERAVVFALGLAAGSVGTAGLLQTADKQTQQFADAKSRSMSCCTCQSMQAASAGHGSYTVDSSRIF